MKLAAIKKEHLLQAAKEMDIEGDNTWAEYWVRLNNGKEYQFKHLARRAYEIATGEKVGVDFFQSNESYRAFIEREFGYSVIFKVPENVSFFSSDDLEFFSHYSGSPYRKGVPEHEAVGKRIKETIFNKTNVWVRMLNLKGWEVKLDNIWQLSGNFKPYSWARIYRPQDKDQKVFFTLGVDGPAKTLVYKIDCQRSQVNNNASLSNEQVEAFYRILNDTNAKWNTISIDELKDFNWEKLFQITIDFIGRYEFLYDEAIIAVQTSKAEVVISEIADQGEALIEVPAPPKAYDRLPKKEYSFKGVVIDYDSENKRAKDIGNGGEELVIAKEKKNLIANGLGDLAEKVIKVKDGEGYDVLSFDLNQNKKFIEVKTTTSINTRPFLMTDNEWEFMKRNSSQYYLYRVYDYNSEAKKGKLFCLSGNLEKRVFTRPKQFEVFIKST